MMTFLSLGELKNFSTFWCIIYFKFKLRYHVNSVLPVAVWSETEEERGKGPVEVTDQAASQATQEIEALSESAEKEEETRESMFQM